MARRGHAVTTAQGIEGGLRWRAQLALVAAAMLALTSCSDTAAQGRCVYRHNLGYDNGGQLRWGPCNTQDPSMHRVFRQDAGSSAR